MRPGDLIKFSPSSILYPPEYYQELSAIQNLSKERYEFLKKELDYAYTFYFQNIIENSDIFSKEFSHGMLLRVLKLHKFLNCFEISCQGEKLWINRCYHIDHLRKENVKRLYKNTKAFVI